MPDARRHILSQLADGAWSSGTVLARQLNMSRAAVWKHVEALRLDGVPVESGAGHGYRIAGGLALLEMAVIQSGLSEAVAAAVTLHLLEKTASTNDWLLRRLPDGLAPGGVCLAERQSAGRGTRGRQWQSPYGCNIYLSLYWRFDGAPAELGGLSLAMAAIIGKALTKAGARGVKIKWPNDLYAADGKLGGILIDVRAEAGGPSHVVIGVGLNVGMPLACRNKIEQAVADLLDAGLRDTLSRSQLAAIIIDAMVKGCRRFDRQGFAAFRDDWLAQDMVVGRRVKLTSGAAVATGKACGVDEAGALELQTASGRQRFSSGDVTLRLSE